MKLRRTVPLALAILAAAGCSAGESDALPESADADATPAAETTADAAVMAVDAVREAWVTHYNLHHPDMVADLYAPEAMVLHADQSVYEGRDEVEAWLVETMTSDPTATVTGLETLVFGDRAVTMGTYQVDGTSPEGGAVQFSGHYMNVMTRMDGEWLIEGSITNYDAPRPDDWVWGAMGEGEEPPPEEGTLQELVEAYETHWNLQHPDMVADLYTEDAKTAFADEPFREGRTALATRMAEVLAEPTVLDVHDVGTVELDEDHRVDGGWYELRAGEGGDVVQSGMYMLLAERQADGSWAIQRMVTNGRPMGGSLP